jgi:hypothetical protein
MGELVGVRERRCGPLRFARAEAPLAADAAVLLETPQGPVAARVVVAADQLVQGAASVRSSGVLRRATPAAWRALPAVAERERATLALARARVAAGGWPVELVAAAYDPFDERVTLVYEAHAAFDPAALARMLEAALDVHVVLHAAVPPGALELGALARLAAARSGDRGAPPARNAAWGEAAALLAALSPRNRAYLERRAGLPRLGQPLATALGTGQVIAVDVPTGRVTVRLADATEHEVVGPPWTPAPPRPPRRQRGARAGEV